MGGLIALFKLGSLLHDYHKRLFENEYFKQRVKIQPIIDDVEESVGLASSFNYIEPVRNDQMINTIETPMIMGDEASKDISDHKEHEFKEIFTFENFENIMRDMR